MASTFTGPVACPSGFIGGIDTNNVITGAPFILRSFTTAQIASITSGPNVVSSQNANPAGSMKMAGSMIWNSTLNTMKVATGSAPASTWVNADGTLPITPV